MGDGLNHLKLNLIFTHMASQGELKGKMLRSHNHMNPIHFHSFFRWLAIIKRILKHFSVQLQETLKVSC